MWQDNDNKCYISAITLIIKNYKSESKSVVTTETSTQKRKMNETLSNLKPMLFVHIPKTGGTSVSVVIRAQRCKNPKDCSLRVLSHISRFHKENGTLDIESLNIRYWDKLPLNKLTQRKVDDLLKSKTYFKWRKYVNEDNDVVESFAVVRNPFDRLLSAYSYLRFPGFPINKYYDNITMSYHNQVKRYPSFAAFVYDLPNLAKQIVHLVPQHKFICDNGGKLAVTYIARTETLQEDILKINPDFFRKYPIGNKNVSNKITKMDVSSYLTPELCQLISLVYHKDFEMFNYDPSLCPINSNSTSKSSKI